jgi:hypothetical protein
MVNSEWRMAGTAYSHRPNLLALAPGGERRKPNPPPQNGGEPLNGTLLAVRVGYCLQRPISSALH